MCMYKNYSSRIAYHCLRITYKESASTFSQTGDRRRWKWRMEAAVATATLGIWDEEGCSKSILQEWQLRSRTAFRTAFVPSQNPNPETLVVAPPATVPSPPSQCLVKTNMKSSQHARTGSIQRHFLH
ncbi:unnamed protein product [Musa acuminata subsp. burmannicoides]